MAINLSRSTRLFVSSVQTGNDENNTFEIKILDGYSFSQTVQTQEIVLEEASCTPVRGAKTFNTALDPVEVSFPMYMKPYKDGTESNCVESIIWEAFASGTGTAVSQPGAPNHELVVDFLKSDTHSLELLQLFFQLDNTTYLVKDVTVGTAEIDFAIDQIAQIAFSGTGSSIEEIDTSDWEPGTDYAAEPTTNKEFIRNKLSTVDLYKDSNVDTNGWQIADYQGSLTGATTSDLVAATDYTAAVVIDGGASQPISFTAVGSDTLTDILAGINLDLTDATATLNARGDLQITSDSTGANSSVVITDDTANNPLFASIELATYQGINAALDGVDQGKQYFFGITGGSITLENNITSLVPEELGIVNQPLAAFSGARSFTGTLNAYLNTGSNKTGGLLNDLLADTDSTTNRYYLNIQIGGCASSGAPVVQLIMPYTQISVPTVSVEDVISTEIAFRSAEWGITQREQLEI